MLPFAVVEGYSKINLLARASAEAQAISAAYIFWVKELFFGTIFGATYIKYITFETCCYLRQILLPFSCSSLHQERRARRVQ